MPREETPRRQQDDGGVAGVKTNTPWDAIYPAAARFTNSASRFTRRLTGGIINFTGVHDTDLGPKKRKRFIAAGGEINPPGVKHKRGSPVYFWQGEQIGKRRAFKIVKQIKRGLIPAFPQGNGGTVADQANSPLIDYGWLARGPRTRGRKRKKKPRSAAAILAARVLQTGEEVFGGLLDKARGAVRYVEPEFDRLLKKAPSEFERLLYRTPDFVPGAARESVKVAARTAVSVAARAAGAVALVLYPSTIGTEPPWAPPTRVKVPRLPPPAPPTLPAPVSPAPARPMRRPLPLPKSRPFPAPASGPTPTAAPRPVPTAVPAPTPSPTRPSVPSAVPRPSPFAWSSFVAPLALGISARGSVARSPRNRVVPKPQPLTAFQPAPASSSNCDCQKPTRTKRERSKRCSNPVISRKRSGDTITTVRKIKCPA